jgi:ankyrin repeat protein
VTVAELFEAIEADDAPRVESMLIAEPTLAGARGLDGTSAVRAAVYRMNPATTEAVLRARPSLDVFDAAAVGDVVRLRALLDENPAEANRLSNDGFTALHLASFFGHLEAARLLLDRGATVSTTASNPMRVTPLHSAAAGGDGRIVTLLLERGADPNLRQSGGYTALHAAAQNGDLEMVRSLIDHGANRGSRSNEGTTPAQTAARAGHARVVEALEGEER